jgi:hypothetical protein
MDVTGTDNGIPESNGNTTTPQLLSSTWNYRYEPNQLFPELANVMSLSPFDGTISASRKQMFGASHTSQCLVFDKPTPRRIQTGAEIQYGRATFSTKIERDCKVLHMIQFYNPKLGGDGAIRHNPETMLIVQYEDGGEVDCISMREYFSNHQYFGFPYKNTEATRFLRGGNDGSRLKAGTILQDSPSKRPDGNYCYGTNLNVMFASFPEVAEDGVLLSDEVVDWLTIRKYEKRTVPFGSTHFPLNIYGDPNKPDEYKPFPEIGDWVRPDGLLMVLRSYSDIYSPVEMSAAACREINYPFDKTIYVPSGKGRVIDIRVSHDSSRTPFSPSICNEQALKYDRAAREFYKEIYKHYTSMRANTNGRLKISHNFKNLVKHAYSVIQEGSTSTEEQRVQKIYRASPMDDFTIEFVIEYEAVPKEGYKLTDCWGGKGVVVKVVPKNDMPVDKHGNRVHVIMDGGATVSRQNLGRLYEQFFNACSRDLVKEFCDLFNVSYPETHGQKMMLADKMKVEESFKKNDASANAAWDRFTHYIEVISPEQVEFYYDECRHGRRAEHMISLLEDGIYLYHPSNNDPELPDVVDVLKNEFMPHMSQVTYRGNSGNMVTTRDKILIGEIYFILLEKTGDDWTSVSSGKLQNFGILSHINNQDKHSSPWRQQAIRAWGETETAIGTAYMGWRVMAEIIDRNNNITTHRHGVYNILRASQPTNIPVLIDRKKIPLGSAKPLELVKHLGLCNGWEFVYKAYVENEPKPTTISFVA